MDFRTKLISELTQLDAREARRDPRPNPYRLGIYMNAAQDVIDSIADGATMEDAFADVFTPSRGMHTVARRLGLRLDVERGNWVPRENYRSFDGQG